ncbi:thrombospondin type-1 domain-containing protein 7A [Danio aesculapii]|uniref:thrombospondin type-1 domain-containing protein 7A n=1 Tax=Danio aesculapii TaxID=1142201 RepID=UPI0024BFB85E|nr:thrombospondin type-1 domain-containing protein 7A [Danio aesculapii]
MDALTPTVFSSGPWGRCMGSECGPGGSQSRAVWCAHVEGWTTLHTNCLQSSRPANQQSCFRVCDWHKDLYDWRRGAWNQCVPISLRTGRTAACLQGEEGIQTREVYCSLRADGSTADDAICEYFEPKPRQEQACLIPCPKDCVVTEFTPWTTCSKTCGLGLQNRVRSVVAPPLFGGLPCPNLTEFQTCAPRACEGRETVFNLRVGGWSECQSLPVPAVILPTSTAAPLRAVRQTRRRKGKERKGSRDPEMRELIKSKRNRNRLSRMEDDLWNMQIGFQARQVVCVHRNGSTVPLRLCPHWSLPELHQSCLMPRDCVLSDWSEWSSCSKTCSDPTVPQGSRSRSRQLTRLPSGGGSECSQLEESQACEPEGDSVPPCALYSWRSTEWSECRVDALLSQQDRRRANHTGLCGGGVQTREVYCVQANAELLNYINNSKNKQEGQSPNGQMPSVPPLLSITYEISASPPVDVRLCKGATPSATQLCHIQCPVECQLSPWGAWGPCTFENCDERSVKKGFKFRRRSITNYPTGGEGSCAHLVESIPCDDPTCFTWQLVKLEECIPEEDMDCGEGMQNPQVRCINNEGVEVEKEMCSDAVYPSPVPCVVPCPKDCALSLWTEWSTCSQTCSSKNAEGKQMRTRAILAYNAGEVTSMVVAWITVMEGLTRVPKFPELYGGSSCPNTSALQQVRNCNEHACVVYHWQTGPWSLCVEDGTSSSLNSSSGSADRASCTAGIQTRKVICVKVNVGQVPPKKCPEAPRPESVQVCQLPCKRDCIVTPYSEWTDCPTSCDSGANGQNKQSHYRVIIQRPANGGQECPDTLYEEKDCAAPAVCPGYRWKTHKWRKCQLVPWSIRRDSKGAQENCGAGIQTRAVSCRQLDGGLADVLQCLRSASSMPAVSQLCQLPCRDDCQLSGWSRFSPCSSDCVGVRTRRRNLLGKSKKKDKCKNSQMYPLSETQYCPCDKYNAQPVGNWSDCVLPEGMKECGQGYRYQAMVCYDQDNRLVETSRCNSHGYIEEACIVPCPSDCKLSEWSNWSRCSKSCGSGVKVRSKWLREKPYNGGRPCPKLDHLNQAQVYEVVPCVSDCSQYVWVSEPWSVWKVSNVDLKENCGEGVQTRRVRCMMNTVDGPADSVEDYLCDPEEMPPGTRESRLPCPEDCVLSEWSRWTSCDLPCTGRGDRERTAFALRLPKEGEDCPVSMQTEPCLLNRNCFHYSYNITDWSTCQLSANAVCGIGLKTRMLDCVRSDGKSVDLKYCKEGRCGESGRWFRHLRVTVAMSLSDGAVETPVPFDPATDGSTAVDVVCGVGVRFRNLSCFVSDGSSDGRARYCGGRALCWTGESRRWDKKMLLGGDLHLTLPCVCVKGQRLDFTPVQVPFKGCHAQEPENIAQCPDQEWQWGSVMIIQWMGGLQLVWCQRSDGINVTGGCPPALLPGADQSCDPLCDKPQSFCSEESVCMCEEGFTEVLTTDGALEQCAPIPVLEIPTAGDKKADVKTSRAINPTLPTTVQPGRVGRTWYLQPFGADGKLKTWVYGVAAGVFVLLVFIVSMIYLACSYCAIRRSLGTPDSANGTVVWMGQDAHELTYTCPECQQESQGSRSS